jgi:hypothetical protein
MMIKHSFFRYVVVFLMVASVLFVACNNNAEKAEGQDTTQTDKPVTALDSLKPISEPLVSHIYTADPSAHVFEGKIYIYPSHDYEAGIPEDDLGSHFAMKDFHILSMDSIGGKVTDHGVGLDIKDIPWAGRQLWAPDAAFSNGKYYLYFPVKDKKDVFRIGVATAATPAGPFKAEATPIAGTYSIDPAVFKDDDGTFYMYFGGIWGGQLQRWSSGKYVEKNEYPAADKPALAPKVAKMNKNMLGFDGPVKDVLIIDENGKPLTAGDSSRRFFEGSWLHKYNGKYYFSYSTGDTHFIAYAIGDNPWGPFTYKGVVLKPVQGWTNHHSIIEIGGKWYFFYHDVQLSGQTHLRNIKVTGLKYRPDGTIETIDPYTK